MVTAAVVIATYRRPDDVARCLDAIGRQTRPPDELVVVDASPDTLTRDLVASRPGVTYLRNEAGMGTLPTSRAMGFATRSEAWSPSSDTVVATLATCLLACRPRGPWPTSSEGV